MNLYGNTAQLTNTAASVLMGGTNDQFTLLKVNATNTDTTARTVSLWLIPNAGSAGNSNILVDAQVVQPAETVTMPLSGFVVGNGNSLFASADVTLKVTLAISYATQ